MRGGLKGNDLRDCATEQLHYCKEEEREKKEGRESEHTRKLKNKGIRSRGSYSRSRGSS